MPPGHKHITNESLVPGQGLSTVQALRSFPVPAMSSSALHALPPATATTLPPMDEDGFLLHAQDWSPALAAALAAAAGVDELGPAHWRVIEHVRGRYFALGSLPVMRLVCRAAGIDPGSAHRLFDSCSTLWRVAGLPHPGEEAKAYMH